VRPHFVARRAVRLFAPVAVDLPLTADAVLAPYLAEDAPRIAIADLVRVALDLPLR
jgi:hypothetical protein